MPEEQKKPIGNIWTCRARTLISKERALLTATKTPFSQRRKGSHQRWDSDLWECPSVAKWGWSLIVEWDSLLEPTVFSEVKGCCWEVLAGKISKPEAASPSCSNFLVSLKHPLLVWPQVEEKCIQFAESQLQNYKADYRKLGLELSDKINIWQCPHTLKLCCASVMSDSVTPWTVVQQAPLFLESSRQEYWSGLTFLIPGDLPNPRIKPASLVSLASAGGFFITSSPGKYIVKILILTHLLVD